ncbi:hypothetical protein D3C72_1574270 [compost metagenome]
MQGHAIESGLRRGGDQHEAQRRARRQALVVGIRVKSLEHGAVGAQVGIACALHIDNLLHFLLHCIARRRRLFLGHGGQEAGAKGGEEEKTGKMHGMRAR